MYEAIQTGYAVNSDGKTVMIIFVAVVLLAFFGGKRRR